VTADGGEQKWGSGERERGKRATLKKKTYAGSITQERKKERKKKNNQARN